MSCKHAINPHKIKAGAALRVTEQQEMEQNMHDRQTAEISNTVKTDL